jgi:precorrin-6B methylase 1
MANQGSVACVGLGMTLGAHLGPRARSHIEHADVVFAAVGDPLAELWLQDIHPDVRSLQPYYAPGKPRHDTYREMVAAVLAEVRAGRRVCAAFYGHPGVFAQAPHRIVEQARAEGFDAVMEPGISAEDCLYADLGIDPGRVGCAHFEASQFMLYKRVIDPSAVLVLWQVGIAGDRSCTRWATDGARRQVLVELLAQTYPRDHEVILYEAATLAIGAPRMQRLAIKDLAAADVDLRTTLVVPPCRALQANTEVIAELERLDTLSSAA